MDFQFEGVDFEGLDFGVEDLTHFEIDLGDVSSFQTRYLKPKIKPAIKYEMLKYKNAEELAKGINADKGMRAYSIVDGTFIFGDFIEAFIVQNKIYCYELWVSTLSLSQDNVDSFNNLLKWGLVKEINLIVSAYFFSHERSGLVQYMYETLDYEDRFQLAVASTHCKTVCMKTTDGLHIVMHGSANLRSSSNLEQFCIEDNEELYNFNMEYNKEIADRYRTIDKPLRRNTLWRAVQNNSGSTTNKDKLTPGEGGQ